MVEKEQCRVCGTTNVTFFKFLHRWNTFDEVQKIFVCGAHYDAVEWFLEMFEYSEWEPRKPKRSIR